MLCAIVDDGKISEIKNLAEDDISDFAKTHEQVINIEGLDPVPKVGWVFNGLTFDIPPGELPSMLITRLAMRQRFTTQELVALYAATATNPVVLILLDNLKAATFIDLTRQDTITGMQYLVSQGLLTQERATQILTTLPNDLEKYRG